MHGGKRKRHSSHSAAESRRREKKAKKKPTNIERSEFQSKEMEHVFFLPVPLGKKVLESNTVTSYSSPPPQKKRRERSENSGRKISADANRYIFLCGRRSFGSSPVRKKERELSLQSVPGIFQPSLADFFFLRSFFLGGRRLEISSSGWNGNARSSGAASTLSRSLCTIGTR